jgi:ubiquinone/menaquinone biosynthesis C-methylase UbiE
MSVRNLMQVFFRLLYHPFACTYDFVAAAVSFGRWNDWVRTVQPLIDGRRVLELGHGPGHLQRILLDRGLSVIGLDESAQMGRLAGRRLGSGSRLTRGLAQNLPFPKESFETIVATFPTEYIFDQRTLSEIRRCLSAAGRLVVLPAAWPKNALLRWLYKVTGENPSELSESLKSKLQQPFKDAGFATSARIIEVKSSQLLIVLAQKR